MQRADRQDEQSIVNDANGRRGLRIGEVSKRSGMGIEALRFYERSGLLERPPRTESGYRVYDEAVLKRLAFIKQAQALGFALDEVKRIVDDARREKPLRRGAGDRATPPGRARRAHARDAPLPGGTRQDS